MDFFRADRLLTSLQIIKSIFTADNIHILVDGSLYEHGLNRNNFSVMIIGTALLVFVDVCKREGIALHKVILEQDLWFRWLFFSIAICLIMIFGIWGPTYDAAGFIYLQF